MDDISVLIGGKAGDGINSAGALVARLLSHHGYSVYLYFDYPSLIRGGHNFAIVRGHDRPGTPKTCRDKIDFILALDQASVDIHQTNGGARASCIFNEDLVRAYGQGIPVHTILLQENAPEIMGNSALIGGFARAAGIPWETVAAVFPLHIPKAADQNLRVARLAFDQAATVRQIPRGSQAPRPLLTGNEAIGLGLVRGGLDVYISYPMTPSSSLLHFLAAESRRFGITVVHPENEIAVILMALGFVAAGKRSAVGTSGGGFCLMTEGLSLAGNAEIPVVIVMSQRTGPSTGLPTYTGQADLRFVLHAGQGEFPRLVVAPADANEAILWSARALDLAWRCQVPAFILADKTLSEGTYSTDVPPADPASGPVPSPAGTGKPYQRYLFTPSGISPFVPAGSSDAVVKTNSYTHDEAGITTEDAGLTARMAEKRLAKEKTLAALLDVFPTVHVSGNLQASTALLVWGSVGGAATEAGEELGLKVIRPLVLCPFPKDQLTTALDGVTRCIVVEENSTGQLADLAGCSGIAVHERILKYDGRPFTADGLSASIREVL